MCPNYDLVKLRCEFQCKTWIFPTLSLGVWHTDQNFIRSFWERYDGTHKTWPTILVALFLRIFLVYNQVHSLFRHQFCRQARLRMAKLVFMSLLACALSSPSPHKKHPLKLGQDLRGHKQVFWLPEWQKKQLKFKEKPSQLKDVRVCNFQEMPITNFVQHWSALIWIVLSPVWRRGRSHIVSDVRGLRNSDQIKKKRFSFVRYFHPIHCRSLRRPQIHCRTTITASRR